MLKSISKTDTAPANTTGAANPSPSPICQIAKGTTIEGKFTSTESVLVDGTIRGEVYCQQQLVMGKTGLIDGNINTQSAIIKGHIKGSITVQGLLRLENSAKVEGTILAKFIEILEGAQYDGECKIGEKFLTAVKPKAALAV